jgi:hypothetical protein
VLIDRQGVVRGQLVGADAAGLSGFADATMRLVSAPAPGDQGSTPQ